MPRRQVRILLADDHEIVRQGTRSLLETRKHSTICGEATTGVEAIRLAAAQKPDIVVMDVTMPGMSGLDATREIQLCVPSSPAGNGFRREPPALFSLPA